MIRRIEALRYRCLRDVAQELHGFQVLVGPNASGKSTFLDVLHLLSDILNNGLQKAAFRRSPNPHSLFWMEQAASFEVAVEFEIPKEKRQNGFTRARYEVALGLDTQEQFSVLAESLWLKPDQDAPTIIQRCLFPSPTPPRASLMSKSGGGTTKGWRNIISKKAEGDNHYFKAETTGWNNPFRLGPYRLGLSNLPEDEERFPVAIWVKRVLMEGIHKLVLNGEAMRNPSPVGSSFEFQADGSNLPWVLETLRKRRERYNRWIAHVKTALPDVRSIETVEKPEDKSRYLRVSYANGLKAPSWSLSDGTLRLLALVLLAYLDNAGGVFLVEEPENGIHPQAVETVFQSLSSSLSSQILCASHSPVVLSLSKPEQVLCFARTEDGVTDIIRGSDHPNLRDWRQTSDLGTLFATGILG